MNRRRGDRGERVDREFVRRAERGTPLTFLIVTLLLGLAWYPFLEFGLSLVREGQAAAGWAAIAASGVIYLGVWLQTLRARRQFVDDARAGRIRLVPIRAPELRDEMGRQVLPENAGGRMGYERPHADDHLWWMLALALFAGWVMHEAPWESPFLRAFLQDPIGAFSHGIKVPTAPPSTGHVAPGGVQAP